MKFILPSVAIFLAYMFFVEYPSLTFLNVKRIVLYMWDHSAALPENFHFDASIWEAAGVPFTELEHDRMSACTKVSRQEISFKPCYFPFSTSKISCFSMSCIFSGMTDEGEKVIIKHVYPRVKVRSKEYWTKKSTIEKVEVL